MKYFSFLCLAAGLAHAQAVKTYTTDQAARMVIGQYNFTAQDSSNTHYQFGAVSGLAFANNTLFVVDSNYIQAQPVNNRVLIYNNVSSFVRPPTAEIMQGVRCPVCIGPEQGLAADVVLGQPDFGTIVSNTTASGFNVPTAVASDGHILAVADTNNNRVLIWNSIPQTFGQPADVVLGQANFTTVTEPPRLNSSSLRGPQGVWIQGTQLFVADTGNHRIMVWNTIPTSNNQPASFVLGQPNFTTVPVEDNTQVNTPATASNMLEPVSVTSDGTHLFVSDLGHSRVMIWNSIPTQTNQPADLEVGQPDLVSNVDNNAPALCPSNGTDANGKPTYPPRCEYTLSFPRYALSDGTRLYIADAGNDRILIFNSIPTQNAAAAHDIIGQVDPYTDQVTDCVNNVFENSNLTRSSADTIRSPMSLAWDGQNLYASDPFDMRVLVYTPANPLVPFTGVVNAASRAVFAIGAVDLSGTITANDTVTITIGSNTYTYTIQKADTLASITTSLVNLINTQNGGDPNVYAINNPGLDEIVLTAKQAGPNGNNITYSVSTSTNATIVATAQGTNLTGGGSAAQVAPGTLVEIQGTNLSDNTAVGQPSSQGIYPTNLGGVEVYIDGLKVGLTYVSPTQINTQVPFEVADASSTSLYIVIHRNNGEVDSTTNVAVPIVPQNPGVFAYSGQEPRTAIAYHGSSNATVIVSVDGTITAKDQGTITINSTNYVYTVQSDDTLDTVRDAFVALVNADPASPFTASAALQYDRIILTANTPGPAGEGIPVSASSSTNATLSITVENQTSCCDNVAGVPVTPDNPAAPGEIIYLYATGLGPVGPDAAAAQVVSGANYNGPAANTSTAPVDNAQVGGATAVVLQSGLVPGAVGTYEVKMQLPVSLGTNALTQAYIAQNIFISNVVTLPIVAPANTPPATSSARTAGKPGVSRKSGKSRTR